MCSDGGGVLRFRNVDRHGVDGVVCNRARLFCRLLPCSTAAAAAVLSLAGALRLCTVCPQLATTRSRNDECDTFETCVLYTNGTWCTAGPQRLGNGDAFFV